MSLPGATDREKLEALGARTYKEQAVWYLNGFWKSGADAQAERIWQYVHEASKLDPKGAAGGELDEFQAHRFLEVNSETLTVLQFREHLRSVGIDKVRTFPFCNFLVFKYKVEWHALANAPQGDNQEEVARAQRMLEEVQAAFAEANRTADLARAAQAELEVALKELQAQEDARNQKTAELQQKSTQGGVVQQNKAKNELAQHLAEDPLPLRRAKITTEAAKKKADKAKEVAEAAEVDAQQKLLEAEAYLEEVKSKDGSSMGSLWWIDRELHEAKAYLPASKGGYKKAK